MIKFHSLSWKNFLSTGNNETKIQLDTHKKTVFLGESGSGKSTILDVVTFVLYNKPFRSINKGALVNSINEKGCLVEISLSVGSNLYRIVRGIKPNVFEIYRDDVLINQDAKSVDYQKVLEEQILKFNLKAFCQIVTLGAASFTPFMQLSSSDRRTIIEEILGIEVFSYMTQGLKERIKELKEAVKEYEYKRDLSSEKIAMKNKYLDEINKNNQADIDVAEKEKLELKNSNSQLSKDLVLLGAKLEQVKTELSKELENLEGEHDIATKLSTADDAIIKFEKSLLTIEHKEKTLISDKIREIQEFINGTISALTKKNNTEVSFIEKDQSTKSVEVNSKTRENNSKIVTLEKRVKYYQETDFCNVCEQPISKEVKEREVTTSLEEIKVLTEDNETIKTENENNNIKCLKDIADLKTKLEKSIIEASKNKDTDIENATITIKEEILKEKEKVSESLRKFNEAKARLVEKNEAYAPVRKLVAEIKETKSKVESDIRLIEREISLNDSNIEKLTDKISLLSHKPKNTDGVIEEIKELTTELKNHNKELDQLAVDKSYCDIAEQLLKDGGIKSQIVKQYLPLINQSINDYLQKMDFYVAFNLDENFNETILSRGRDTFSYCNFSEGEKQRINIAILFTWRLIARMKNSMSTNLLIMDEIFDSYLDPEATDNALKLLDTEAFSESNVIIISHKNGIGDRFDRVGNFYKEGNYSMVEFK